MTGQTAAAGVVGGLLLLGLLIGGALFAFTGTLVMRAEEPDAVIPPELEVAYRQGGHGSGVNWAALAAWDAAEYHFALPVPSADQIYNDKVQAALDAKRRAAERWCEKHPDDASCPPDPPELTPQELQTLWRKAYAEWRGLVAAHIEGHVTKLQAMLADFDRNPETVYRRFLTASQAANAAQLFEGYQLLDSLAQDADQILLPPTQPPADWVPVDGFAWPVVAPITSRFGMRISPIDGVERLHAGIDLGVVTGTPIGASKAGTVAVAEMNSVYGLMVVIDHGDGYQSLYAHNSALAVNVGQTVQQGQVISQSGSTGWATGPHLHFEIHYHGTPVDPLLLLSQRSGRD